MEIIQNIILKIILKKDYFNEVGRCSTSKDEEGKLKLLEFYFKEYPDSKKYVKGDPIKCHNCCSDGACI